MAESKGHLAWIDGGSKEAFVQGGEVYIAPAGSPLDVNGFRQGARWECSKAHWDRYYDSLWKSRVGMELTMANGYADNQCPLCGDPYTSPSDLSSHVQRYHEDELRSRRSNPSDDVVRWLKSKGASFAGGAQPIGSDKQPGWAVGQRLQIRQNGKTYVCVVTEKVYGGQPFSAKIESGPDSAGQTVTVQPRDVVSTMSTASEPLKTFSSATCPYCSKTVAMSRGALGDHRVPGGLCDGAGRQVESLDHRGRAVFAAPVTMAKASDYHVGQRVSVKTKWDPAFTGTVREIGPTYILVQKDGTPSHYPVHVERGDQAVPMSIDAAPVEMAEYVHVKCPMCNRSLPVAAGKANGITPTHQDPFDLKHRDCKGSGMPYR